ncbi:unnamed protein product [Cylicostephanus goldi]|uniref:glucuronosyltransferase n=1 Tax=Cylicostephanus goldi TaxID=71465 RepID=A0A3P6THI5_CYLGO|nr:unnamed protein product [Cylicostephanus goldi]
MVLLAILLLLVYACDAYRILVVNPKFAYSHVNYMGRIADVLVDAGHDVVTLQLVLAPFPNNGTEKSRLIQVEVDKNVIAPLLATFQKDHDTKWTESATNPLQFFRLIPTIREFVTFGVGTILDNKQMLQRLASEHFDVGIAELFDFSGLAVFEAIGLKNIIGAHTVSSLMEGSAYAVGVPVIPSYVPGIDRTLRSL